MQGLRKTSQQPSCQNWLEGITYQMNNMVRTHLSYIGLRIAELNRLWSYKQQAQKLDGLPKMYATSARQTATDAVQIFGGRG